MSLLFVGGAGLSYLLELFHEALMELGLVTLKGRIVALRVAVLTGDGLHGHSSPNGMFNVIPAVPTAGGAIGAGHHSLIR